jgi:hypothetical protein
MSSKRNFIAKHTNTFNRASTHLDKKNDYVRTKESKASYLDEWAEEVEQFTEGSKELSLNSSKMYLPNS